MGDKWETSVKSCETVRDKCKSITREWRQRGQSAQKELDTVGDKPEASAKSRGHHSAAGTKAARPFTGVRTPHRQTAWEIMNFKSALSRHIASCFTCGTCIQGTLPGSKPIAKITPP